MSNYADSNRGGSRPRSGGHSDRPARLRSTSGNSGASQGARRGYRSGQGTSPDRRDGQRPYRSNRNYRTINGHDTGYSLRQRGINFSGRKGGLLSNLDQRSLLILAGGIIALLILIFAISSCVRGCASGTAKKNNSTSSVNSQDARVSASASPDITSKLTPALDNADSLYKIAKNADKYKDSRLIDLAVNEPDAIKFVLTYPDADHTSGAYEDTVEKGTYPLLFNWDSRWGNVDFGDGALGVTGSAPTSLAMAYMGLTGKTDQTPATIAKAIADAGADSGDTGMATSFFDKGISTVGLSVTSMEVSKDNLHSILGNGSPALVQVKDDSLTATAHWILVIGYGNDGSLVVYDPTSSAVSSHSWDAGTISSSASALYSVGAASQGDTGDGSSDNNDNNSDTSNTDENTSSQTDTGNESSNQ
ncbi:C39 family peptidase [Olegusella massiliensis]|uniref:C39 family peptidase n=1 Tax=Olegusella massiliensis TaxID=1776381 RepID=UPI004055405B